MKMNVDTTPTIAVKFNKKNIVLSAEDAAKYAQMGMKYEQLHPLIASLDLAAAREDKNLHDFVDEVCSSRDKARREAILARVGGDEELADILMQNIGVRAKEKLSALEKAKAEELTDEKALRREFSGRKKDFHGVEDYDNLPKKVKTDAISENISLFDSWLRYRFTEEQKCAAELENQSRNRTSSANIEINETPESAGEIGAMLKGVGSF